MKKNDENYRMSGSKQTVNDKLQDKQIPKKNSQKRNYQKELEKVLGQVEQSENVPSLLLHSCCAPCSSWVLEYLSRYFRITILYFNPNIAPAEEYDRRVEEQKRLVQEMPMKHPVSVIEGRYQPREFYEAVKGLEKIPEGGVRCEACFRLRLLEAAKAAKAGNFDYVTTTLTISPMKNAETLNRIGQECAEKMGAVWLPSDFKKKNGYKRSVELSSKYGLYRQDYCGCVFSRKEREEQKSRIVQKTEI